MDGTLRKRKKEPTALSAATARTFITLKVVADDEKVKALGPAQMGNEVELEVAIQKPNTGTATRAYVQEEYDELAFAGGWRLVKVRVVAPKVPAYVEVGSSVKLRGMVAFWDEANPPPFEGPAVPA